MTTATEKLWKLAEKLEKKSALYDWDEDIGPDFRSNEEVAAYHEEKKAQKDRVLLADDVLQYLSEKAAELGQSFTREELDRLHKHIVNKS